MQKSKQHNLSGKENSQFMPFPSSIILENTIVWDCLHHISVLKELWSGRRAFISGFFGTVSLATFCCILALEEDSDLRRIKITIKYYHPDNSSHIITKMIKCHTINEKYIKDDSMWHSHILPLYGYLYVKVSDKYGHWTSSE